MGEQNIDLHTGVKYDYELTSNGSSASLSLNDSYSYESDFASGSSMRSSFGEYSEDFNHISNKLTRHGQTNPSCHQASRGFRDSRHAQHHRAAHHRIGRRTVIR